MMLKIYSLVVWVEETGDFKNASQPAVNEELAAEVFEMMYGNQVKIVHIFEGEHPPKTYRSLPYI